MMKLQRMYKMARYQTSFKPYLSLCSTSSEQHYSKNDKSIQQIKKSKQQLSRQLSKEIAFASNNNPLPDFHHLTNWHFSTLTNQQYLLSTQMTDYHINVMFTAQESQLLDVQSMEQVENNRKEEIEKEKIMRERQMEDDSDLTQELDSMKQTFNFTVALQKNSTTVVYECASIDFQLQILHILFPENPQEYLNTHQFERLTKESYPGPEVNKLSKEMQLMYNIKLHSLGIDKDLLQLVYQLATYKEEEQYNTWLQQLHNFIQ